MLVEAPVRRMPLDVSSVDNETSHTVHTFPCMVNIQDFVPGLMEHSLSGFGEVTKTSVWSGFTTVQSIANGMESAAGIVDTARLNAAQGNAVGAAHCHCALCAMATRSNVKTLDDDVQSETKALYVPFRDPQHGLSDIDSVAAHFAARPTDKSVIINAATTSLASVLLLATFVTCGPRLYKVTTSEYIGLIAMSKAKAFKATRNVWVYGYSSRRRPTGVQLADQGGLGGTWGENRNY